MVCIQTLKLARKASGEGENRTVLSLVCPFLTVVNRYASISAVLVNKRVADGIRDSKTGYWFVSQSLLVSCDKFANHGDGFKHGHTYQAHPLAAAASLAVQHVISSENLMENTQKMGLRLQERLKFKLLSPNCVAAPYVFDIRGGGLFWGVEFDVPDDIYPKSGHRVGILIQEKALKNGLVIMGLGGTVDGVKGDHCMLSPAYNVTPEEIDQIVDLFVQSVEEIVREFTS